MDRREQHLAAADADGTGAAMLALAAELYPLCRSITGPGLRATLDRIGREIPLARSEVPSGTPVLDWTIPREWTIRDAFIARVGSGERVVDFRASNLHVLNYSMPVDRIVSRDELEAHLWSLPEHPDWIPYRTSYWQENWGFCISERQRRALDDGAWRVLIDADLADGSLSYGECVVAGSAAEAGEVLVSCHSCHPSLANDNLSGIAVATFLARYLLAHPPRLTWRFLFAPGTIGAIAWLARNETVLSRLRHGLTLANLGDAGGFTYKASRRGDAAIDRVVAHVLRHAGEPFELRPFTPYGYDERQYCSPGFDLPVGCLMRTPHNEYPEYHSSADDLSLLRPEKLAGSLALMQEIAAVIEGDETPVGTCRKGEPQLGRRGLYASLGGLAAPPDRMALLWVLNLADGGHSLLDVAERAALPFAAIRHAADALRAAGLLEQRKPL